MFYINNKRIVPKDIILTPIILRQWYISDGSVATYGGRVIAKITDVSNVLLDQLKNIIGIDCSYKSERFYIPKRYVEKFTNQDNYIKGYNTRLNYRNTGVYPWERHNIYSSLPNDVQLKYDTAYI
jgi:hypothetical protein